MGPTVYGHSRLIRNVFGQDASATTFVFDCATDMSCGPVTVIQGPSTAIFTEVNQPYVSFVLRMFSNPAGSSPELVADHTKTRITIVWECEFTPSIPTATSLVTPTSPGYSFAGTSASFYPSKSPDAFPTYLVDITADFVNAATTLAMTSLMVDTAAVSASIPAINSGLFFLLFHGSLDNSADATSTADSSTSSSTATGTTTSITGLCSSSAIVTSAELSATNMEASSSGTRAGPEKSGAATSFESLTATLRVLKFVLYILFGL